jgi:hypothetical protein
MESQRRIFLNEHVPVVEEAASADVPWLYRKGSDNNPDNKPPTDALVM